MSGFITIKLLYYYYFKCTYGGFVVNKLNIRSNGLIIIVLYMYYAIFICFNDLNSRMYYVHEPTHFSDSEMCYNVDPPTATFFLCSFNTVPGPLATK